MSLFTAFNIATKPRSGFKKVAHHEVKVVRQRLPLRVAAAALLFAIASLSHGDVTSIRAPDECSPPFECHEIRGLITQKDARAIKAIVANRIKNRQWNNLFHLNSNGGDVDAAIAIGRELRRLSAIVAVSGTDHCMSACIFVLAGGTHRVLGDGARIGIHRPYSLRTDVQDYETAQKEHNRLSSVARTYLSEMNIPTSLYDAMVRVPPESMRLLTQQELLYFGLSQTDPVEQELIDAAEARGYGLTKFEYIRRKAQVATLCTSEWSDGQRTGNFDRYFACKERVMRGLTK